MNCKNQSRGLQDVAARNSTSGTIHSLIQSHEAAAAGRNTIHGQTANSNSSTGACSSKYIEQLSIMSKAQYNGHHEKYDIVEGNCVLVAVNAAKMSRHALEWALTNVVQPEDHITLLALFPGRRLWSLALISGDCARRTVERRASKLNGKPQDVEEEISEGCSCMMQELRSLCDSKKAKVSIKVVAEGERGAIAMEADRIGASWVVLDKHVMKKEGKVCLEQLKCNVVMVKQSKSSKILRLNLRGSASARHDDPKLASTLTNYTQVTSLASEENAGVIGNNRECDYRGNQPGSMKRAAAISSGSRAAPARLSSSSTSRANHRFKINGAHNNSEVYDGAASSDSSDADNATCAAACAHLFTSDSESSDSTMARHLRYNGALCTKLLLDSDHETSHEYGYSDLDILSSSCEMHDNVLCGHSGLLCTPATSSPSNDLQESGFDLNVPVSHQQLFTQGMGEMVELFREAWKPAPCIISSMSKPNSASTTPKSDTLTLTGSSYPKPSRSPSPSNQDAPPVQSPNHQAPPPGRVSRSPSPSKSNICTPPKTHNAVGVKLSSSSACTNLFYAATTTSTAARSRSRSRSHLIPCPGSSQTRTAISSNSCASSKNTGARRHDFVRPSRQMAQLAENGNVDPCSTSITGTSSSVASGRIFDREVTTRELMQRFSEWDHQGSSKQKSSSSASSSSYRKDDAIEIELNDLERTSSVRRAMSMLGDGGDVRHVPAPAGPPPLCSICQHKAPVFGKPPRRFSYAELQLATGGFSKANFLAEGGFGSVHRGVLPDGQPVAVKQHKLASSQGDNEFCSEVEVLSCAQHRNVVMLIGYCIEHCRRLLVYEFICNGSLDSHLYAGSDHDALSWAARQKVAIGAARGLRYLHEECRVGCIIHRDMRPNNILLTHDYEPMVGDFGLARWQPDGDLGVQTRVIGTFGYLAPEYAQSGEVTEKADVYSFGVVLLELVTGRKAVDLARPKGQQCLTEWARPLLEDGLNIQHLIDPRLPEGMYGEYELFCTLHAASLCIRRDPHLRPRMSQVLRILEGDVVIDTSGTSTSPSYFTGANLAAGHAQPVGSNYNGSRSSRISGEYNQRGDVGLGSVSPPLISYSGSLLSNAGVVNLHVAARELDRLQYSCRLAKLRTPHKLHPYFSFEDS